MLIHSLLPRSAVNGPGERAVVWLQGCGLHCPGCWNKSTHRFDRDRARPPEEVGEWILSCPEVEGVTFSGGEPMQQADSLLRLIRCLRQQAPELSFGMFSGYAEHELDQGQYWIWGYASSEQHRKYLWQEIRACLDFAILGRFYRAQPSSLPLRTSRNQVLRLFTNRYSPADFSEQLTEVSIHKDGQVEVTGFPLGWP